jgi:beta-N-acetylhexosaminidase
MSLAQRVGQLFIAGVSSSAPTAEQVTLIRTRHLGGAILMGHTDAGVAATAQVSERLQAEASTSATEGVKLWVAVDQEGGFVQVLNGPGFSAIPTALAQGEVSPATLAVRAQRWAAQLKAAGVNLDLAPVMDTVPADLGTDNAPIGHYDREYGHTPQRVARHGTAVLEGMQREHVESTAKHFPGLGRVHHNPDTSPVVVDKVTTRDDPYLAPFQSAINDGIAAVMVSSARYTQIDRHHLGPFSSVIMRDVLRGDLGFSGVIISDDLGNAAVVQDVPVGARAVRFIRSGGTVVLTVSTPTVEQMTQAVVNRATASPAFNARVRADALLVLKTKHRLGLLPCS